MSRQAQTPIEDLIGQIPTGFYGGKIQRMSIDYEDGSCSLIDADTANAAGQLITEALAMRDRIEALEARLGEVVRRCNTLESNSYTGRLEAENARLTDVAAQAHSLFDLCWNAIQTAIAHEDGLDGGVGKTLMAEIREWQARNSKARSHEPVPHDPR